MRLLSHWWSVLLLLGLWQAWVSWSGLNAIVVPHPADVARDLLLHPGLYARAAAQTLLVAVPGLAIGLACGTGMAVLARLSAVLDGLLTPLALILSSVPVVAIIPILARLLGYGLGTVVAIVAVICFLPSFVFTAAGLRALPAGSVALFQVFGAARRTWLLGLALPAAVPSWMTALRLSAPAAILAAMTAEYLMGTGGLGALFHATALSFHTERAFGCSLVAMTISIGCFALASRAEQAVLRRWR